MSRGVTIADSVERLRGELIKLGVTHDDTVISTNLALRLDGLPRSNQNAPDDPGAAVYWRDAGQTRCMAIDNYTEVEQNLAALAATIEAMRAIERHGGAQILDRAFTGFTALPAPGQTVARSWREVLEVSPVESDPEVIKRAYRLKSAACHPDRPGGSHDKMSEVNWAWNQAQEAIK